MDGMKDEFTNIVLDAMREGRARAEKDPTPNEERFARMETALAKAERAGYAPGMRMVVLLRAYLRNGDNIMRALEFLSKEHPTIARDVEQDLSTRSYSGPDGVSLMTPIEYANELIPLLRPYSVLAKRVIRMIKMNNGGLRFPRVSGAQVAYWGPPQGVAKKDGTATLGALNLTRKTLTGIAVVPNDLINDPANQSDEFILQELLAALGAELDRVHIAGKGSEYEPLGLINYPYGSGDEQANDYDHNAAFDWKIPIKLLEKHLNSNATMVSPAFLFNPTLWSLLMTATTGTAGFLAWLNEMNQAKTICSINFEHSTHIPTASNNTQCVLIDYFEYLFAKVYDLKFERSREATITTKSGSEKKLWMENETGIKGMWSGDMGVRNTKCLTIGRRIQTA